jgi:hypothetical protein
MLSIVIPSKNEIFLKNTILDVLKNAGGEIEVFPVLDGYDIPKEEIVSDPRVQYVKLEKTGHSKKRHGINFVINNLAKGEYVMWLDAHCMVAPNFDLQLVSDHKANWIQIPRRNRLDAQNWALQRQPDGRPPIDYEYLMFLPLIRDRGLHGFRWDARTLERTDKPIDDTLTAQGSCFFMTKKWFQDRGFLDVRYQGWGQEAEEICFETWKNGGRVVTNKNTWYAHLHKGSTYGRMYFLSKDENKKSYDYSFNYWVIENREFFINLIKKFAPLPSWPNDWEEQIWKL